MHSDMSQFVTSIVSQKFKEDEKSKKIFEEKLNAASADIKAKELELSELKNELAENAAKLASYELIAENSKSEADSLRDQLAQLQEKHASLLSSSQSCANDMKERISELEEERAALQAASSTISESEVITLKNLYSALQLEHKSLQDEINCNTAEYVAKINSLETEKSSLESKLAEVTETEVVTLKDLVKQLQSEHENSLSESAKTLSEMSEKVNSLMAEKSQLEIQISSSESAVDAKVMSIRDELSALQSEYESVKSESSRRESELTSTMAELEQSRLQLTDSMNEVAILRDAKR